MGACEDKYIFAVKRVETLIFEAYPDLDTKHNVFWRYRIAVEEYEVQHDGTAKLINIRYE